MSCTASWAGTRTARCAGRAQGPRRIQRYVHIGTGNYNPDTARKYTDLGLFTTDADIGADVTDIFNYLTGYSQQTTVGASWSRRSMLRTQILERIKREAEHAREDGPAHIIIKINGLTDPISIRALYRASQAGVQRT